MTGAPAIVLDHSASVASVAMAEIVHATLSADEFELFAGFGTLRSYPGGSLIFTRGSQGRAMYIVARGMVELDFGEELLPKYLGLHEYFGELGLLIGNHLRTADARANGDVELLEIDHTNFRRLVDHAPGLVAYFLRRTIMRVTNHEASLIRQLRRRNNELEAALDNLYSATSRLNHTEELVRTDELTGVCNRRGLSIYLQTCRSLGKSPPQGLLLIDCDQFKQVNDIYGHLVGDRVLQSVANVLRSIALRDDLPCRLGGDEFCLVVSETDHAGLQQRADFILSAIRGLVERANPVPRACAVSIGAALLEPMDDWNHWYAMADGALYRAKHAGGNRLVWHHSSAAKPD
jgi:diguanylate cyclase (GGDEF)-like protein